MPDFPRPHADTLRARAARLLDSRKPRTPSATFAREVLADFYDACMRAGLDRVLVELQTSDRDALLDHPTLVPALADRLDAAELDGGSPRNAKPGQVVDCVVAALGLTLADDADQPTTLDDKLRVEVSAALGRAVEADLAVPRIRDTIVSSARAQCEPQLHSVFDRIAAQLDERGLRMMKTPKVPLDQLQMVQRHLADARTALIDRIARAAIDAAKAVIANVDADAAARIDRPVTHQLTPRDVAILRASDPHLPKTQAAVVESLLASLSETARLAWRVPEQAVRPYAASQSFAVGELVEHPKFGRGTVVAVQLQRIEVEFADNKVTLVHKGR
jgi:hypothetical protein